MGRNGITLYHLAISHYNEKARWALDIKRVPHERRALVPGLHRLQARRIAGGSTLPALVDADTDTRIGESSEILQYLDERFPDPRLYPEDDEGRVRVLEIERSFDEYAGPAVRAFSYFYLIDFSTELRKRWEMELSSGQRRILGLLLPALRPVLRRKFDLTPDNATRCREQIVRVCDRVEAWLQESGSGYLHGDGFTAADLAGASLLGPLAGPEGSPWATRGEGSSFPPAPLRRFRQEFREREAGRWVLEMWRRHRTEHAGQVAG